MWKVASTFGCVFLFITDRYLVLYELIVGSHHFASSLAVCLFVAISFNCNLALLQ